MLALRRTSRLASDRKSLDSAQDGCRGPSRGSFSKIDRMFLKIYLAVAGWFSLDLVSARFFCRKRSQLGAPGG
jgi:hypothetical protein